MLPVGMIIQTSTGGWLYQRSSGILQRTLRATWMQNRQRTLSGWMTKDEALAYAARDLLAGELECLETWPYGGALVPARGVEPPTFALRMRCSTN